MVDLDDVAAAHALAAVQPGARGRYLLCERFALMSEMAAMLRWRPRWAARFPLQLLWHAICGRHA